MATIKIVLREQRLNSRGEAPLTLRITKDRKSSFLSLDKRILPAQWNADSCAVKRSHPGAVRLNAFISTKVSEAQMAALELEMSNPRVSAEQIKQKLLGNDAIDFYKFSTTYLESLKNTREIGTYKLMKVVVNKVNRFRAGKPLVFSDFTLQFIKDFDEFLRTKLGNGQNTAHTAHKNLKRIILQAINSGHMEASANPFLKYKLKTAPTQRAFLTEDELSAFESVQLQSSLVIFHHQQAYVFASYAGGLRVSDVLMLRWRNFDGTHLTIQVHKTKAPLTIKLPTKAVAIIESYRSPNGKTEPEQFIFPLIKLNPADEDKLRVFQAISSATAYLNKDLKVISKLAGIDKKVSFHTSRHTWATRALRKGMRIEYVSKLMGHTSVSQTEVYAKIVNAELDKAMGVFE